MVTPYPPYFEVDHGYPPKSLLRKCLHGPHGVGDSKNSKVYSVQDV
jgi:hypothetical protein